jgi:prepilin-type N-terminal cleavage/methylation domain-containing protein
MNAQEKGFTILEVLIAIAIFGIGILAVAKMQLHSTGQNTVSRVYTESAAAGAGQIEEIINMDYDDPNLDVLAAGDPSYEEADTGPDGMHDIEWRVEDAVTLPGGDVQVKRIDITVNSKKFPERDFTATYYKAITY